jgi:hypothetical protein
VGVLFVNTDQIVAISADPSATEKQSTAPNVPKLDWEAEFRGLTLKPASLFIKHLT